MYYRIENNIIETDKIDFDFAKLGGVGHVMFQNMKRHSDKIAQIEASTGKTDSFKSLLLRSIRTALALKARGIGKGDIVTGCSDNHLNATVPILASYFIGAIPCSIDPSLSVFEFNQLIQQVKPKILFTISKSLNIIEEALSNANLDTEIVVFDGTTSHTSFEIFLEAQENENEFKPIVVEDPKETCVIYFSSGTSGFPKGICINHYYYYCNSPLVPPAKNNHLDEDRQTYEKNKRINGGCFLNYGTMYWGSSGQGLFISSITGVTRLLCASFSPEEFWLLVPKYNVLGAFLTPFQVTELVKTGKPSNVDTSSLVRLATGGAALSKKYFFALQELLPDTDIIPTYAQTETGILAAFQLHNKMHREHYKKNPETVGLPVRGVRYKVVDPDTEQILGPNEEGELRVKSLSIMNGYYNRDSSNRYDKDGWFRTGDVVRYDESCFFYVVDRVKEMLKYRGWHIPPAILELELSHHPAVRQSVVIGKPHEEDGDHPMAIIVLESNAKDTTAEEIEKYIEERVHDKQRLRGGIKFVQKIPMTPSGKVKRRELKRMVLEEKI